MACQVCDCGAFSSSAVCGGGTGDLSLLIIGREKGAEWVGKFSVLKVKAVCPSPQQKEKTRKEVKA